MNYSQIKVFDNDGKTLDRYTVVIKDDVYTMSDEPFSPLGINGWVCEARDLYINESIGHRISFSILPDEVKRAIKDRME